MPLDNKFVGGCTLISFKNENLAKRRKPRQKVPVFARLCLLLVQKAQKDEKKARIYQNPVIS